MSDVQFTRAISVACLAMALILVMWSCDSSDWRKRHDQERARRIYLEGQIESARQAGHWPSKPAGWQ